MQNAHVLLCFLLTTIVTCPVGVSQSVCFSVLLVFVTVALTCLLTLFGFFFVIIEL